ncbi:MAG: hypothetical protein C0467_03460 [Planctomycetaceae bacterium]|nr:hypothetical protein [Planctomycetaceae bacterium]
MRDLREQPHRKTGGDSRVNIQANSEPTPSEPPPSDRPQLDAERLFVIEPGLLQASRLGLYPPDDVQVVLNVSDIPNEFVAGHKLVAIVQLPLADHEFPGVEWLELVVDMLSRFRRRNFSVVVHCDMAESRSSLVILGYFMRERAFSLEEALADLRTKNPHADPNHRFLDGLEKYEEFLSRG